MKLVQRKKQAIIAQCESCGRLSEIPYAKTINPHMPSIDLKEVVKCECGEYHNLVIDTDTHRIIDQPPPRYEEDVIRCPRCHSPQISAGNKGFGLGKAAAGGVLIGPVGLLGGLIGHKKTIITCLKCGHKWQPGKP